MHGVNGLTRLDMAIEAVRCPLVTEENRFAMVRFPVGMDSIREIMSVHYFFIAMTLGAHVNQFVGRSQLLHAGGKMAVEFLYINLIVVTDQTSAEYPFRNAGMGGLEVIERPV
jgi:hypothetical protein